MKKKVILVSMLALALGSVNIASASHANINSVSTINTFEGTLEDRQYYDELIESAKREGKYSFSYAVPLVEPKDSYFQPFATTLPYNFTFNFDSYLYSQDFDNKKSTVISPLKLNGKVQQQRMNF